jgi:Zn-dependent M28 family amino/carboxypeptidase
MIKKIIAFFVGNAPDFTLLMAALLIGSMLGWFFSGLYYEAQIGHFETQIATLHKDHAIDQAAAAANALSRLQAAQKKGDELTRKLADADAKRQRLAKEKDREIKRLSTGRACLGAGLVGLLNDRNQGSGIRHPLPAPSGLAVDANRAAASDTDLALWARDARDRHDACRERIDALRQWHEGANP